MIGSAPGTRGGVAALVELYAAQGLFQRWGVVYVPTHRDGSKLRKLGVAAGAWLDVFSAERVVPRIEAIWLEAAPQGSTEQRGA